jgi:dihydroorotate dehydrogenase electron transfer subunit
MSIAHRGIVAATVLSNTPLCREHYRLTFRAPGWHASAPGQFVQLQCRNPNIDPVEIDVDWVEGQPPTLTGHDLAAQDAFLRRPFSIAGRRGDDFDVIGREVGPGTRFLSALKPGDTVSVLGPLGNTFSLPPAGGIALLVGGGVGIPPMIYLAQALAERNANADRRTSAVAFCGATTRDLLALTPTDAAPSPVSTGPVQPLYQSREFADFGVPTVLTTDDGSLGVKGFVTAPLEAYLDAFITDNADRNRTIIYTCGPEPMMKRIQDIASRRSIVVQIAVERAMACGMGTCQSCCIRVKKDDPARPPLPGKDWCYRLACTDGPVFDGDKLLW